MIRTQVTDYALIVAYQTMVESLKKRIGKTDIHDAKQLYATKSKLFQLEIRSDQA